MTAPVCIDCGQPSDGHERRIIAEWLVLPLCPAHRAEANGNAVAVEAQRVADPSPALTPVTSAPTSPEATHGPGL